MTNLVPVDFSQLPSTQVGSDDDLKQLSRSTSFLPRMQLYSNPMT
jgi:hypothetical protein